jgi:hypothetical protein
MCFISSSKEKTNLSLEETPIVCEYPNVYIKDLLDLPLRRAVDFHIDLISDAIPMSKTLCRFTLVELTKLKK